MSEEVFISVGFSGRGQQQLDKIIKRFDDKELLAQIAKFFDKQAILAAGYAVKIIRSQRILETRSGLLTQSITGRAELVRGLPSIRIGVFSGPALSYAGIQYEGGKITPRNAANLAIPVNDALTRTGLKRYVSPLDYPGKLRFIPFRRGIASGALYDEEELKEVRAATKGHYTLRDLNAVFLLLKEVKIEPTEYLKKGIKGYLPTLAQNLQTFLTGLLNGAIPKN